MQNSFRFFPFFLVLYEFTTYIANDMIMPAMPMIAKEFNAPDSLISNSLSIYILGGSCLQVFLGPISDRFGRRPVLLAGAFFFLIFTLFLPFCETSGEFLLGRFFQGTGLCFITVVGYAALQEIYEEKEAIKLVTLMASVSLVAPLLGPVLGGVLTHYYEWRLVFYIIALMGVLAFLGLLYCMPETAHRFLDSRAALSKKPDLTALPAFNWDEISSKYSRLWENKSYIYGVLGLTFAQVPILCWIGISPVIICNKLGLSNIEYGLWQIPFFGSLILGNVVVGALIKKYDLDKILQVGNWIVFVSLFLTLVATFFPASWVPMIPFSLYGFGIGTINASLWRSTLFVTDVQKGTTSAFLSVVNMVIISITVAILPLVYWRQSEMDLGLYLFLFGVLAFVYTGLHLKSKANPSKEF